MVYFFVILGVLLLVAGIYFIVDSYNRRKKLEATGQILSALGKPLKSESEASKQIGTLLSIPSNLITGLLTGQTK